MQIALFQFVSVRILEYNGAPSGWGLFYDRLFTAPEGLNAQKPLKQHSLSCLRSDRRSPPGTFLIIASQTPLLLPKCAADQIRCFPLGDTHLAVFWWGLQLAVNLVGKVAISL